MKTGIIKEQYEIDKVFIKNPWKPLTYSEIQKTSKKNSKGYIYKELKRLSDNKMIRPERIGKRALVYHIVLGSASSQRYWGFLHENTSWNIEKFPFQIIENLRAHMPTSFFSMIVTGSYAKGKQTNESDLDVVIISDYSSKEISAELKYEADTSIPKVHLYAFTSKEFLEMLNSKKENYGKEIARNNLIFFGGASYYSILQEAISHGFKG